MKKKNILIGISILVIVIIVVVIAILVSPQKEEETKKATYSNVVIDGYQIKVNDSYEYEYDKDKKEGYFKNKMFEYSYLYLSDKSYGELIRSSSYYTNMGADELDTDIEEVSFGGYEGFINEKKVYYDDVEKEYHLVLILIKVSEEKTFVVQYEVPYEEDIEEILDDIKMGLMEIKKVK